MSNKINGNLAFGKHSIRFVAAFALVFAATAAVAQSSARPLATLLAKDVSASGLAMSMADTFQQNIVVLGDPARRISINETNVTVPSLWHRYGDLTGLVRFEFVGEVYAYVPRGCNVKIDYGPQPISNYLLSLHFSLIPPSALIQLLGSGDVSMVEPSDAPPPPSQLISVRMRDVSAKASYLITSAMTGIRLIRRPDGKFEAKETPDPICVSQQQDKEQLRVIYDRSRSLLNQSCPRLLESLAKNLPSPPRCAALEYYGLESLVFRGRIEFNGQTKAIVESPDGVTHLLGSGDGFGYFYGKVLSVDSSGVTLQETLPDSNNTLLVRRLHINYNNERKILD